MDRTKTILGVGFLFFLLGFAGCGGNDDSEAVPEPSIGQAEPPPSVEPQTEPEAAAPVRGSIGGRTIALPDGRTLTVVAGSGEHGFAGDGGPAIHAALKTPAGLAFDGHGNMYVGQDFRISKVDANGEITTVAGTGTEGYSGDGGPATEAEISRVEEMAFDSDGNLYFADRRNFAIRRVDSSGVISTVVEVKGVADDGGPFGVAFGPDGNLYFSVAGPEHTVSRLETDGTITTVAGTGPPVISGDGGPATEAGLDRPRGLAFGAAGNLFIGGEGGLRKVDPDGVITTLIEDEQVQFLAPDADGNLYLADQDGGVVSKLSPGGERTVILEDGVYAWADDGPTEPAPFVEPIGVALDAKGTLYISHDLCPCVYRLDEM